MSGLQSSLDDGREDMCRGRFLRLVRDGHWEYVARINSRGAAFIVACTDDDELVLVEQYRVPLRARTIELPAGLIGDGAHAGEPVEASALRELEEETGFRAARAQVLFSGPTAPGLAAEQGHFVRATGLQRVAAGGGVDGEDITVHCVSLSALRGWLVARQQEGLQVDARIFAGVQLAGLRCG